MQLQLQQGIYLFEWSKLQILVIPHIPSVWEGVQELEFSYKHFYKCKIIQSL